MKKLGHYYGLASKEGVILISYEYNITGKCEEIVTKTLSKSKSDYRPIRRYDYCHIKISRLIAPGALIKPH